MQHVEQPPALVQVLAFGVVPDVQRHRVVPRDEIQFVLSCVGLGDNRFHGQCLFGQLGEVLLPQLVVGVGDVRALFDVGGTEGLVGAHHQRFTTPERIELTDEYVVRHGVDAEQLGQIDVRHTLFRHSEPARRRFLFDALHWGCDFDIRWGRQWHLALALGFGSGR